MEVGRFQAGPRQASSAPAHRIPELEEEFGVWRSPREIQRVEVRIDHSLYAYEVGLAEQDVFLRRGWDHAAIGRVEQIIPESQLPPAAAYGQHVIGRRIAIRHGQELHGDHRISPATGEMSMHQGDLGFDRCLVPLASHDLHDPGIFRPRRVNIVSEGRIEAGSRGAIQRVLPGSASRKRNSYQRPQNCPNSSESRDGPRSALRLSNSFRCSGTLPASHRCFRAKPASD